VRVFYTPPYSFISFVYFYIHTDEFDCVGFSFAGGKTDGPGVFDFVQGDNKTDGEQCVFSFHLAFHILEPRLHKQVCPGDK
jgi:hypothetical protein